MHHFDLSIYYPIPLLTTEGYISLIKTALMVAPENPPEHVKEAIVTLGDELDGAETTLVERIDEDLSTALERLFDSVVDRSWHETRQRMVFASIYLHEGTAMFTEEDRIELEYEERVEEAHAAAKMHERIFGGGLDFLRSPYPQQSTHTAARLDWIASKDLGPAFEEVIGPKLFTLLKVCQRRYEAMVGERSSRDGKSVADLRELRNHLRCVLSTYVGAIGTLYKVKQPETAAVVENALRPILIAREYARRKDLGLVEEAPSELEDEPLDEDEELEGEGDEAEESTETETE